MTQTREEKIAPNRAEVKALGCQVDKEGEETRHHANLLEVRAQVKAVTDLSET